LINVKKKERKKEREDKMSNIKGRRRNEFWSTCKSRLVIINDTKKKEGEERYSKGGKRRLYQK
jgi:hypothetical protein